MGNAQQTKERILDAALREFATHGVAGARVDRIAAAAEVNKNSIYMYFESKEKLFSTVLEHNLRRVYDEVAFTPDDLSAYATRVFDFALAHPMLLRLMAWSTLEGTGAAQDERTASHARKLAELHELAGDHILPPAFLLTIVMSIATAWTDANPFGTSLDPGALDDPATLRHHIATAARLLATPSVHE